MAQGNLVVILGDQLSEDIAALQQCDKSADTIVMMEVNHEATYVPHHKHKLILILSAMRHFAESLQEKGYDLHYIQMDSKHSQSTFAKTLGQFLSERSFNKIIVTHPSEYRVLHDIRSNWQFGIDVDIVEDDRFYCSIRDFKAHAEQHSSLRMEYFYREMRRKSGILMDDDKPVGGQWNFDKENRHSYDGKVDLTTNMTFEVDAITQAVIDLVEQRFAEHMGQGADFNWAVTRRSALRQLNQFIDQRLAHFGRYQDAMVEGEYQLFHSLLSPYINLGLLTGKEVVDKVVQAYEQSEHIPINAVEGFVRQILGWREYVRGIYWLYMPEYANHNHLDANQPLPDLYWTAKTKMACMRHVVQQTIDIGHSHHIQRLMISGNFALLAAIDIKAICDWYLAVYVDAYEWVELPNTLGMVCYADNGLMASKPYAASGNYINKMSNFCKNCHYKVKEKTSEQACPFNALYWDFLMRNQDKLKDNQRLTYPYATLKKMSQDKQQSLRDKAKAIFKAMQAGNL